jgi:hypothetical protein
MWVEHPFGYFTANSKAKQKWACKNPSPPRLLVHLVVELELAIDKPRLWMVRFLKLDRHNSVAGFREVVILTIGNLAVVVGLMSGGDASAFMVDPPIPTPNCQCNDGSRCSDRLELISPNTGLPLYFKFKTCSGGGSGGITCEYEYNGTTLTISKLCTGA